MIKVLVAFHVFLFAGVAVFYLVVYLREPYGRVMLYPVFLSLAVAVALGVVWWLI